jgi:competence protein ComEA
MQRSRSVAVLGLLCGLLLASGRGAVAAPATGALADGAARVNLNSASADELARLPGIGPAKAKAIVAHRAEEPFHKPEDLRKVKGIGDKLYEQVKDHIMVGEPPAAPKGRGS